MPKVSAAPLLGLLAAKVPLVAVKWSNATVSISIGAVKALNVGGDAGGGTTIKISGIGMTTDGNAGSEFCVAVWSSFSIKLIGCTGSGLRKGGALDPGD